MIRHDLEPQIDKMALINLTFWERKGFHLPMRGGAHPLVWWGIPAAWMNSVIFMRV